MDYQNIRVIEPVGYFKAVAKDVLRGRWQLMFVAALVYILVTDLPGVIFTQLFGADIDFYQLYQIIGGGDSGNIDSSMNELFSSSAYDGYKYPSALSGIYTILVSGPLELGLSIFCIFIIRRAQAGVSLVFSGFTNFLKAFGVTIIIGLICFACLLVAIIPTAVIMTSAGNNAVVNGILAFYSLILVSVVLIIIVSLRYGVVYFILADEPNIKVMECLKKSGRMMKGNKSKMFLLIMSFVGWYILYGISAGIVGTIMGAIGSVFSFNVPGVISECMYSIVAALLLAPIIGYVYTSLTAFYEKVAGHMVGMDDFDMNENQRPLASDENSNYLDSDR